MKNNEQKIKVSDEHLRKGVFKKVPASQLSFEDNFMNHVPKTEREKWFMEDVKKVIEVGVRDFWRPVCDPAFDANGGICYEPGKRPAEGKSFDYTDQAIRITGTMAIEDMVDEFGYAYNYYIADASYEVVDLSTVSEDYALWQAIATDGIVTELNAMFDYLYYLCQWPEYQMNYVDENGEDASFFLYPGDVIRSLEDESANGYGAEHAAGYFPGLVSRIRAISADGLEDLVAIVEAAQQQADIALEALNSGAYTYDEAADKFTLNDGEAFYNQFYEVYYRFTDWLARWEL